MPFQCKENTKRGGETLHRKHKKTPAAITCCYFVKELLSNYIILGLCYVYILFYFKRKMKRKSIDKYDK